MAGNEDNWSWSKFFSGFINGKNYAKALVLGFCMFIIGVLAFCTFTTIASRFKKVTPTQTIGSNQGIISTENEDKSGNSYSLLNLWNGR